MKESLFEDFLKDKHAEGYMGTDDDMIDEFDAWVGTLDEDDLMKLADEALIKQREKLSK